MSVQLPLATFSATSNASVQTQEVITGMDTLIFYEVRVQERAKYIFDAVTYFSHRNGGEAMGMTFFILVLGASNPLRHILKAL